MPRINIKEVDDTLVTSSDQLYNVVYVPGFSANDDFAPFEPTLITSVAAFHRIVGDTAAKFGTDESYSELGFSGDCVPSNNLMFAAGDEDPSFAYAESLIAAGLPVVYEKVNSSYAPTTKTVSNSTTTPKYIGFQYGTSAPTTATLPTDPVDSVGEEYFIQVIPEQVGSEGVTFKLFLYEEVGRTPTEYIWKEITDKVSFEVEYSETQQVITPTLLTLYGVSAKAMYDYLENHAFNAEPDNPLYDRNSTQIKYLTTGGYAAFEYHNNAIVKKMQALANPEGLPTEISSPSDLVSGRGDCIVLVDHTANDERELTGEHSVFYAVNSTPDIANTWSAMITPWFIFGGKKMPGSFAYLISLAKSVETNPNWLAVAGVTRGVIPGATALFTTHRMTRAIADSYMINAEYGGKQYNTFINPIVNIRPYGYTIWGNRTLAPTLANSEQALYYLNMRSLIAEIKKRCYSAAEQYMFEQNSDVLWINFKSKIMPLLDQMSTSYGISGYKIIKEQTDNRTQLKATIRVYPIYAVEDFDITVVLTNEEVEVEE